MFIASHSKFHQKSKMTTLTMTTLTTIKIRLTPYGASLIVLDFPVTFTRVACHLCCQVALGEAEGATLGNGCKHLGKLGKSGECEEESYGGKDTAVDYS